MILYEYNATAAEYPQNQTIHQLFRRQAETIPDSPAVVGTEATETVTYGQLSRKARQQADGLRQKGIQPGSIVALLLERSVEMLGVLLGILEAGCAYLPIDPQYPAERINYMLADSNTTLLLTTRSLAQKICKPKDVIYCDEMNTGQKAGAPTDSKHPDSKQRTHDDPAPAHAYVIYTSGTTGKPKGVLVGHRGIVNLVYYHRHIHGEGPQTRMSQVASPAFDAMAFEIWPCLTAGATLYLADNETRIDAAGMKQWLIDKKIEITFQPTAMAEYLLKESWPASGVALRILRAAGDRLTVRPPANCAFKVYNLYGPTEDSVWTTWAGVESGTGTIDEKAPVIGKPIANHETYILGPYSELQPPGIAGEICIAGIGLAEGYLNRPQLTAEKFVTAGPTFPNNKSFPNNQSPITNTQLYHTGDLGRHLQGGNIEFLGRSDHQVKIRGYRIELGEIEKQLIKHEKIDEAVVAAKNGETGDKYLCAYLVTKNTSQKHQQETTIDTISDYLAKTLPDYMVPSYFLQIEKIPLTPNGKIDLKTLPHPEPGTAEEYVAPRSPVEKNLAQIWGDILGKKKKGIGIDTHFFKAGGHSLKATAMIARVHKEIDVRIPVAQVFNNPTIRQLAAYIKRSSAVAAHKFVTMEPAEKKEYYPLSPAQKRFYLFQQINPESIAYNVYELLEITGPLDGEKIETLFQTLIRRHESLRTTFETINGDMLQRIHRDQAFKVENSPLESKEKEIRETGAAIIKRFVRPFLLSRGPLIRVGLIKIAPITHILAIDMHHIIADGTSIQLFIKEFVALYKEEVLPPTKLQYKDYLQWAARNREVPAKKKKGEEKKGEEKKGEEKKGEEVEEEILEIPTDYPRPAVQDLAGDTIRFETPVEVTNSLMALSVKEETALYSLLLAIFNILLAKLSGQENIVVGSPIAGRNHIDLENIIGLFLNTIILRNYPTGEKPFSRFLAEVIARVPEVFEKQDTQYDEMIEQAGTLGHSDRNPLFDVMFAMQNMEMQTLDLPGLTVKRNINKGISAKFDLTLYCEESSGTLQFTLEYATALF
ncbi:MAG: amino acid adenylation domain-containing protein, partial [bacterium]|nr:amino acid adenylation domain-containing protein [bacterium]